MLKDISRNYFRCAVLNFIHPNYSELLYIETANSPGVHAQLTRVPKYSYTRARCENISGGV